MRFPTSLTWSGRTRSTSARREARARLRIGIPRALNVWSTHQFWLGFLAALGVAEENVVFSSETSEEQGRVYGKGRGTVDCCYPVKCLSGHYGELLYGQRRKLDVLLSPMIHSVPSVLGGHVVDALTCSRVMAGPESVKAGFLKERDAFAEAGVVYASPLVSLGDRAVVAEQLHLGLKDVLDLDVAETRRAVAAGFQALDVFTARLRARSREVLAGCAARGRPCVLVLGRPYHMDGGIGHEIDAELQAHGYPILWLQYLPADPELLGWLFEGDLREGRVASPLDISDVWRSSYSANTNEILWGAKFAARCPWITCVLRLSSYECGMDQPTYTPTQKIVEATGTLFFKFGDLDATKPGGTVKIRVETILHYLARHSDEIVRRKLALLSPGGPLAATHAAAPRSGAA